MNGTSATTGTAILSHLLAHHLAQNEHIPSALPFVTSVLDSSRAIARAEAEEGLGGPVLKRWNSRVTSLLKVGVVPEIRLCGFKLLHLTLTSSTDALLRESKEVLSLSLNILEAPHKDEAVFIQAAEVVRLILARSLWHADWARETIGAAMVQRTVKALVKAGAADSIQIQIPAVYAIVSLIPLFPTPLRPIYASLHDLAINLVCSPLATLVDAGSALLCSLYLIAKNGKDGLREAWRLTAEGLVGSIDILVGVVTSDVFAEDPLSNHTLSAFKLPHLVNNSPMVALDRLESLAQALCLTLRMPTSERTGQVDIPVGAIAELGIRLVGMSADMPVKERTDPTILTLSLTLLPRLQVVGCQILAQLALALGPRLVANAAEILGTISRTLITYPIRSPMRSPLSTTYSIILAAIGGSIDPSEGSKSLARVWRCVLEDIGAIAVEPLLVNPPANGKAGKDDGRKSKRMKTYDPTESMELAGRRVRVDEIDLQVAVAGLATLARLLTCPHTHFLPPKLILSTSRLLLAISLAPAFFVAQSSSTKSPTFFTATSATKGIEIACQSTEFRRGVLLALQGLLGGNAPEGLVDRAIEVWKRGAVDRDEQIKHISEECLHSFSTLIHPALPPLQINSTFARLKAERVGGSLGDDIDLQEGAEEFAAPLVELIDAAEMEMEMDEPAAPVILVEAPLVVQPMTAFPSAIGGFPTFSTPTFPAKAAPIVAVAASSAFIVAPVRPTPLVQTVEVQKKRELVEDGDEEDDEDEAMPVINMDSDDEE